MGMDWLYPERAELRLLNDKLRRENEKLWSRLQMIETRLDKISIEQFVFMYKTDDSVHEPKSTLQKFTKWVLR